MSEDRLGRIVTEAPADRLPLWLLPHLYRYYASGSRANHCVDAALTLAAAFGVVGIPARPWPVELVIASGAGRRPVRYGGNGRWDGNDFRGHCVLWLPEHGHFVDVTLEQFREAAGHGPLIGRVAAGVDRATGQPTTRDWITGGGTAVVQRPGYMLEYTAGSAAQASDLLAAPLVRMNELGHRRAGTNLASQALLMLTVTPEVVARARSGPFPRLRQLLDALEGVPADVDSEGNWRFAWPAPTGSRPLLLDQIPL